MEERKVRESLRGDGRLEQLDLGPGGARGSAESLLRCEAAGPGRLGGREAWAARVIGRAKSLLGPARRRASTASSRGIVSSISTCSRYWWHSAVFLDKGRRTSVPQLRGDFLKA